MEQVLGKTSDAFFRPADASFFVVLLRKNKQLIIIFYNQHAYCVKHPVPDRLTFLLKVTINNLKINHHNNHVLI
jgi:hypothetical protein